MKKYIIIILAVITALSLIGGYAFYLNNKSLKYELSNAMSNNKAFLAENSILKKNNIEFKFTIDQLNYYNDSILEKMNGIRKELKIADSKLKSLGYIASVSSKKDTIVYRDTIFNYGFVYKDTIISDSWYKIKVELKYPDSILIEPTFNSEKYIVMSYKKETINPPKKYWILRLFQRKHTIVNVNVVEKSPYINIKEQRFIEIIK